MNSNSTSARPERADQYHLATDFKVLAKWACFQMRYQRENPRVPLSAFSPEDQLKLFKSRHEYKFERDENNQYHLKKYEAEEETTVDPDLEAFIRSPRYARYLAKNYQLMCTIEDASPDADVVKAATIKGAKLAGYSDNNSEVIGQYAFNKHVDQFSRSLKATWKQEKIQRQKGPHSELELDALNSPTLEPVPEATLSPVAQAPLVPQVPLTGVDIQRMVEEGWKASSVHPKFRPTQSVLYQTTLRVKPGDSPSASSSPPHGSETTGNSLSSGSPPCFPFQEENNYSSHSSRLSIDSVDSQANLFNGGAPEGHLGAGLNQVFYSRAVAAGVAFSATHQGGYLSSPDGDFVPISTTQTITHAAYASYSVTAPAPSQSPYNFCPAPVYASQSESEASFATQKPTSTGYALAVSQPFTGMTCYEVPSPGGKDVLAPEYWTTVEGKARYAIAKTLVLKMEDARLLKNPDTGHAASQPLHIFVDLSNIIIGFYDSLKMKHGLPIQKRVSPPPFSFNNLDAIITRGRNVAKKVVAGSIAGTKKRRPDYMLQAEALGYEMNILQRVQKPLSPTFKRKSKNARDLESATPETSGDDGFAVTMKNGEQGVDEVLHLKILQSTIDTDGGATMVLATGDAAQAEYSDGFKSNVERALSRGWNIELCGWSRNISSAWREPAFTSKWSEQFRIIELDGFCEELFDMTIESL
ncbi:hypothetical protein B0T14DRAFT_439211 [Immersiella caudata]|uniref:NYN domain-containing protein n=1 Tax=Immersiella caudata TaxID=314043 RepID=A0AA39TXM1_9PEZI|nr:hypothetical protein B0T14DRAFT_439211 [Immersiella caudata]